ncbi:hypothetical protein [Parvularcula marina]|uniref:Uncharacterized protein n=1 Tax=Parvularcula marina TaxID=2292771 RepID=A0A371RF94_9PROT|nr:hypothetical protein [Parvularcula marina]RFB04112.1 hypothetical protein DX908_01750 [Parvularcula marina]
MAENLVAYVAIFVAAISAAASLYSLRISSRLAKLNAIVSHGKQWIDFDHELATNDSLRNTYAKLMPEMANILDEDSRAVFYFLSQAQTTYHLWRVGMIEKGEYKSKVDGAALLLRDEKYNRIVMDMEKHGFPKKFAEDIRFAQKKMN